MPAITPQFVMDLETRMQLLSERAYQSLLDNLWWRDIVKTRPSTGRKDVLAWLLSTAQIKDQGKGGNIGFDDLVSLQTEVENKFAGSGLKLQRAQLEDTDGGGMDLAGQWSSDIGAYMAYWPQKQAAYFLKNAHTAALFTGYDGLAYFASGHTVNPYLPGAPTFNNLFTGAASGSYPGACPIDDSVTVDVAIVNLAKIFAYIATIKMPNGEDPRFLRPKALIVPPRMYPRAVQLTSAKMIAQAATGGAATADVEAFIKALGFATPRMADELAGFESDTTFYVACEQLTSSQLGAVVYVEREPFSVRFYGPQTQADLDRKQELEWHCLGRNVITSGHPFLLFKCKGS